MALTFSTTVPSDIKTIRGAGRLDYWAYAASGADGSGAGTYLGQVADGGFDIDGSIEYAFVEGEETLSPTDAYITGEKFSIKCTLLEVPIETYNLAFGRATGAVTTSVGVSKQAPLGGFYNTATDVNPTFYQVALRSPNEYAAAASPLATLKGYYQFYKALIAPAGAVKIGKKSIASLPIQITALWDNSITVAAGGPGRLGKRVITLA